MKLQENDLQIQQLPGYLMDTYSQRKYYWCPQNAK